MPKDNPVTYEHWYNAQLQMKERIDDIKNQINDVQSEQSTHIKSAIKENVNGKIDKMTTMLEAYMKESKEWRDSVSPSIEVMKSMQAFSKGTQFFLKLVIMIGGAVGVLYGAIRWIRSGN